MEWIIFRFEFVYVYVTSETDNANKTYIRVLIYVGWNQSFATNLYQMDKPTSRKIENVVIHIFHIVQNGEDHLLLFVIVFNNFTIHIAQLILMILSLIFLFNHSQERFPLHDSFAGCSKSFEVVLKSFKTYRYLFIIFFWKEVQFLYWEFHDFQIYLRMLAF